MAMMGECFARSNRTSTFQVQTGGRTMDDMQSERRTFLKVGAMAGALLTAGATGTRAQGSGPITKGDAAILRFLAAAEIIETDLWLQYAELGGTQDKQLPGLPTGGSAAYTAALANLDADMPQ